jgi:hypothetical protein
MKLRNRIVTVFAALVLTMTAAVPAVFAQVQPGVNVDDIGTFSYRFSADSRAYAFGTAKVTATQGQLMPNTGPHKTITVEDYRSTSPGWSMQVTATDLVESESGQKILKENLSVFFRQFGSGGCVNGAIATETFGTTQAFQAVTPLAGTSNLQMP